MIDSHTQDFIHAHHYNITGCFWSSVGNIYIIKLLERKWIFIIISEFWMISLPPASGFQTHSVVHAVMGCVCVCVLATLETTWRNSLSLFISLSLYLYLSLPIILLLGWSASCWPAVDPAPDECLMRPLRLWWPLTRACLSCQHNLHPVWGCNHAMGWIIVYLICILVF